MNDARIKIQLMIGRECVISCSNQSSIHIDMHKPAWGIMRMGIQTPLYDIRHNTKNNIKREFNG